MSTETNANQETVFWVNRFSERSIRKVLESFRIVEPSKKDAFTVIAADEIEQLEDEQLQNSLRQQLEDKRGDASTIELPVVHMPQKRFSHAYAVLTQRGSEAVHRRIDSALDADKQFSS